MSAAVSQPDIGSEGPSSSSSDQTVVVGRPVVVRRNAGFAALVGAGASAIAIAYLWRATGSAAPLDWALCVVMAAIGALYLTHLVDARTPLLIADDLGVRIRFGRQWRGLPWDAVARVEVLPRHGPVKDGQLRFAPHSMARALEGLDGRGRRAAALNQRLYGAALAVPMGLTTRVSAPGDSLAAGLAALVHGRVDVLVVEPEQDAVEHLDEPGNDLAGPGRSSVDPASQESGSPDAGPATSFAVPVVLPSSVQPEPPVWAFSSEEVEDTAELSVEADETATRPARRSLLGGIGTIVSRVAKGRRHDVDGRRSAPEDVEDTDLEPDTGEPRPEPPAPESTVKPAARATVPLRRGTPRALRAQVTRDTPATVLGNAALLPDTDGRSRRTSLSEGSELRRIDADDLDHLGNHAGYQGSSRGETRRDHRVRPISELGDPVEALVIDNYVTEPAYDPVIGPELAAARTRVGLSVDELAERTRIRPHVIESIEVDDFAPCGGDFYARGHLRTLARVLGREPEPLLAQFDQRYATAPINARRVFEAELATGMTGSMRSTVGGPHWALLIGVVLALVLTWGVVRLFAAQPPELLQSTTPVLNGSAGVDGGKAVGTAPAAAPKPLDVTLLGAHDASDVVVRDRNGKVVWAGRIVFGQTRTVRAVPPASVRAQNAGAIEVTVNGTDRGTLGGIGQPGRRTFTRIAH